ncbi:spondin domain-containing protein [Gayadomonas joobiniege]|uniref:spondin domain-containing protein n=1 Tax=Gayadomonas joobiniege TaxID=1234606 RepID=UPI0003609810|nr:spondin domain-containing protein [Gayadomonas joobiniege]
MNIVLKNKRLNCLAVSCAFALSACSIDFNSDDDEMETLEPPVKRIYQVSLSNFTQDQPFSPPALFTHAADYSLWQVAQPASVALEYLAEGGNAMQLSELSAIKYKMLKEMPLPPGDTTNWTLELDENTSERISIVTMLVNTNDAFTGITAKSLQMLAVGDSYTVMLHAYDAGTEVNDEINIPGPAASGEGFNVSRSGDIDRVAIHPGVLTEYELTGSVLSASHKFDNPVGKIMVKRMQ